MPQTKALQLKPVIVGPVVTPDGALVFRVTITAVSGKQSTVASRFLAAYLKELRINNIPIAWEGAPAGNAAMGKAAAWPALFSYRCGPSGLRVKNGQLRQIFACERRSGIV